ncbi:FAD synthetase, chloroplastic isoform X2 [Cryptomeria japonica]|nr:FAD synthetase, chloroplastic isoform X2 [Cryptomeria japonica]XP_057818341.1 FAD synthetase, chloroplastic isoform X2 [Cryptomeria japonica]XP_059065901.1 FAD synthetase, chloroplastic isoform X2 [Cryptomeria japonica]
MGTKASGKEKLLIDCGPDQQCVLGGIVALGKFDALHIGHRELAIQAAKIGVPFLLSFVGIDEVLGLEKRLPVVAKCDRKRALSLWAPLCGGMVPHEYHVQFAQVRSLSPRQFVESLSKELGVTGVVAGSNYRFGYKASGDASDLVQLCGEFGLKAYIVDPVMDKFDGSISEQGNMGTDTREKGQVSSTLIRKALAGGNIKRVEELLGRKHRLMLTTANCAVTKNTLLACRSSVLNQPPKEGIYGCLIVTNDHNHVDINCNENVIGYGDMRIDSSQIEVTLREHNSLVPLNRNTCIGLEFECSRTC